MAESRVIAITGAFGVLGTAVARKFAPTGARLGLIARGAVPAWAQQEFASHVLLGEVDLSEPAAAATAMDALAARAGGLDVLVNVAGGFRWQKLADGDLAVWEEMFAM